MASHNFSHVPKTDKFYHDSLGKNHKMSQLTAAQRTMGYTLKSLSKIVNAASVRIQSHRYCTPPAGARLIQVLITHLNSAVKTYLLGIAHLSIYRIGITTGVI